MYSAETRSMNGRAVGFTLVELIVTILVLAVLSLIAAPSFIQFIDNRRLAGAAEAVKNGMQFARSEAFKRSRTTCFQLTPGADAQWLVVEEPTCSGFCSDADPDGCLMQVRAADFPGVQSSVDFDEALFDPVRGTVRNFLDTEPMQAWGKVSLESARGKQLEVQISVMGRVEICVPAGATRGPGLAYGDCL
jgi:type IV fimbrial biogenesis protein FimT